MVMIGEKPYREVYFELEHEPGGVIKLTPCKEPTYHSCAEVTIPYETAEVFYGLTGIILGVGAHILCPEYALWLMEHRPLLAERLALPPMFTS